VTPESYPGIATGSVAEQAGELHDTSADDPFPPTHYDDDDD
jgi:hypothetical protein